MENTPSNPDTYSAEAVHTPRRITVSAPVAVWVIAVHLLELLIVVAIWGWLV